MQVYLREDALAAESEGMCLASLVVPVVVWLVCQKEYLVLGIAQEVQQDSWEQFAPRTLDS